MDVLIKYAIYGLIIVAVMGAVYKAWDETIGQHYRDQQLAKDAPIIAGLKVDLAARAADLQTAKGVNDTLTHQVDVLGQQVQAAQAAGDARVKASDDALAAERTKSQQAQAALAAERATLAQARSPEPIAGVCQRAYDELGLLIADDVPAP